MTFMRQYELVERVKSYDPNADEEALNRAYIFAMKMHSGQNGSRVRLISHTRLPSPAF